MDKRVVSHARGTMTGLVTIVSRLLKVRKGEGSKVIALFLYSFFVVVAFLVGRIISGTIFIHRSGIENLPYLYLVVALVVGCITWVYNRLGERYRLDKVILAVTAIFIVFTLAMRSLLALDLDWAPAAFYVFIEIMGGLVTIQFGTFLNEMLNAREIKRLAGVIGAGGVTANLVSFPLKSLSPVIGVLNFLYLIVLALAACWAMVYYLSARNRGLLEYAHSTRHLVNPRRPLKGVAPREQPRPADRHLKTFLRLKWLITGLVALSIFTVTVVNYQFMVAAKFTYHSEAEMAGFFFSVYAWSGVISIAVQFFLVGRLLERFGLWTALLVLPAFLMLGALGSLVLLAPLAVWLTRGSEVTLRYTIQDASTKMLYQSLPHALRRRSMAIDGGIVRPLAQGVGGLAMALLILAWPMNAIADSYRLSYLLVVCLVAWILIILPAYRAYVKALLMSGSRLKRSAGKGGWEDIPLTVIRTSLASRDPVQVSNTLDIIDQSGKVEWYQQVYAMLVQYNDPACDIGQSVLKHGELRRKVVRFLGFSGNRGYAGEILHLFTDEDEEVIAAAIQAYCSLEHERAVRAISAFLEHPHAQVKAASIAGLIRYGGLEGILYSAAQLKSMIESADFRQRQSAAEVLGFIRIESFYPSVLRLINDPHLKVRRQAIVAAGEMRCQELAPAVIGCLDSGHLQMAAVKSLSLYGADIMPMLIKMLNDPYCNQDTRMGLVAVLQQRGGQQAADALMGMLPVGEERVGMTVISALCSLVQRNADIKLDAKKVRDALFAELERYYQQLLDLHLVITDMPSELLDSALKDQQRTTMNRIFGLLSLIYPARMVEVVVHDLGSNSATARANAMEIIDNIFDMETRSYLIPALDNISVTEKIEKGKRFFTLRQSSRREIIDLFFASDDPWLTACALHAIAENGLAEYVPWVRFYLDHDASLLRETALYALSRLLPRAALHDVVRRFGSDSDPSLRAYSRSFASC